MKLSTLARKVSKATENRISLVVDAIFKASLDGFTSVIVPTHMVCEEEANYLYSEGFKLIKTVKGIVIKLD